MGSERKYLESAMAYVRTSVEQVPLPYSAPYRVCIVSLCRKNSQDAHLKLNYGRCAHLAIATNADCSAACLQALKQVSVPVHVFKALEDRVAKLEASVV